MTGPQAGNLNWVDSIGVRQEDEERLSLEVLSSSRALALGALCLGPLTTLPIGRLDTAFRVFQRLSLALGGEVPRWVVELLEQSRGGRERLEFLRQCRTIYVGSPLYTALK